MQNRVFRKNYFGRIIPPNFLLPLAISGIVIIAVITFFEYRSRQQDYIKLLENQATLFVRTLANTARDAFTAADELEEESSRRVISGLKLIEQLDQSQSLSSEKLYEVMEIAQLDGIHIYNISGRLIQRASTGQYGIIPKNILESVINGKFPEIIFSFNDTLNTETERLAAVIPRKKGGVIAGIISAERIQSFRNLFGFGHFLRRFQTGESVEYIVLENPITIVAGIFNGYAISPFAEDSFLEETLIEDNIKTRILNYGHRSIFEAVAPFSFSGDPYGVLRLGLSMREYEVLNARVKQRMIIFGGVFIILGLLFLNFALTYRHRQLLRKDLASLQEYTNIMLENLGSGVISIDKSGIIRVVNKYALIILKREYPELFNKPYSVLPEIFHRPVKESLEQNKETDQPLKHSLLLEGITKWISVKTTLLETNGEPETCILVIDDVTEQILLEEQIRRNEKLTAMRKLASFVAHEIRNPLNSINLITDLIRKKYKPSEDIENYNDYIKTVQNEILRISNIVEEFIRFARPPKIKMANIDFPGFFSELETFFHARMEQKGIQFKIDIQNHPEYSGDNEQFKQIFMNLIENAIDAITPPGEITITGKTMGDKYGILVKDTGAGVPEEDLVHIFDLYFTTKERGSGIGLAVVQQIVAQHKGTIEVKSTANQGTTFRLQFPFQILED